MNSKIYIVLFLVSVLVSSCSQILLKKSANKRHLNKVKEILNPMVILAYGCFLLASLLTMFAYKGVDLSMGPILEATSYLYIVVLSRVFLSEKLTKKKIIGNILIVIGIFIASLA